MAIIYSTVNMVVSRRITMSGIKTVTQAALMWLFPLTWWILLPILLLVLIWLLLAFAVEIRNLWALKFIPLFYNDENRLRSGRRRMFAKHLLRQYRLLDLLQDWRDEHFAEMRIEAEAQGYYKIASILPFPKRARNRLRREKTLTGAITLGLERLILVEGEPGSGKSTALRHVAETMAEQAAKARSTKSIIPIYVDLKELDRPPGVPIDRNLIEFFFTKIFKTKQ